MIRPRAFLKSLLTIPIALGIGCHSDDGDIDNLPNLRSLSPQELQLVEASNNFSFDLMRLVGEEEVGDNFFVSPISVGYGLGMTLNGAQGSTKEGIRDALDFGSLSDSDVNQSFHDLTELLVGLDNKVELAIGNSIWYKDLYTVKGTFSQPVTTSYDAAVEALDFDDPGSKDLINQWIEDKTGGRIRDMIDNIPPDAVMHLVNAIYFKAQWTYQFDESQTSLQPFLLEDGGMLMADMMSSEDVPLKIYNGATFQLIDIPYGNEQFSMTILLPQGDTKTDDLIEMTSASQLSSWLDQAHETTVLLEMPKFKIEYKTQLNDVLAQMGMAQAFTDSADFSDLFEEDLSLFISRVIHQSFIEVNEEGTEAAAATGVEITLISAPPVAQINRPFVFFIRENHSESILFAGRLMNPKP